MGVQDIFGPAANFTGIVSNDYLRIGSIMQNAKIEVDEEGTIAAAVTGNIISTIIYDPNTLQLADRCSNAHQIAELAIVPLMANMAPTFIANRPFIFAIVDLVTSETLFAGRFMGPNAGNSRSSVQK